MQFKRAVLLQAQPDKFSGFKLRGDQYVSRIFYGDAVLNALLAIITTEYRVTFSWMGIAEIT